jgi:hypothetical protein
MKWTAIGFWAVLTEVLAHFLSLAWGFGMLVVAFIWLAGLMKSASAKTYSAHQRIDVLVPQVAAVRTTANNALPKSGGTVTGSLTVNGNHNIGGSLSAGNFSGSYSGGQGVPGGYPLGTGVTISPTTSGFANLINTIVNLCSNAGVM